MKFAYPWLLLLVPLIGLGGYLLERYSRRQAARRLSLFSPPSRLPALLGSVDQRAKRRKSVLFAAGLALLALAAARPLLGPGADTAEQRGAEFYLVLDVSKSMLARDVEPDRLAAIKRSLADWLRTRRGDRIGLILVAGDAFVQAPLTSDYTALREVLEMSDPGAMSLGGTNLPAAIEAATRALRETRQKEKIVVVISDGENLVGDIPSALRDARVSLEDNVTFHTVGVGTAAGARIPQLRNFSDINYTMPPAYYARDEYGVEVVSRLDERALRSIAQRGGGQYFEFTPDGDIWNTVYAQGIQPLARQIERLDLKNHLELFQIPLLCGILLLTAEIALPTRRRDPAHPVSVVNLPNPGRAPAAAEMEKRPPKP